MRAPGPSPRRPLLLPRSRGDNPKGRMRAKLLLPSATARHSPRRPRPTERASIAVICPSLLAKLAASLAVT